MEKLDVGENNIESSPRVQTEMDSTWDLLAICGARPGCWALRRTRLAGAGSIGRRLELYGRLARGALVAAAQELRTNLQDDSRDCRGNILVAAFGEDHFARGDDLER